MWIYVLPVPVYLNRDIVTALISRRSLPGVDANSELGVTPQTSFLPGCILFPRPLSSFLTASCDTFESEDSLVTLIAVGINGLAKEFALGAEVSPSHREGRWQ